MRIWKYFNKYIGVQGVLAILLTSAILVLILIGRPVPEQLWGYLAFAWLYYFSHNGRNIENSIRRHNGRKIPSRTNTTNRIH